VLVIEIGISDWKSITDSGEIILDYLYLHVMLGIKKYTNGTFLFGDEFEYPPIPNLVYQDSLSNPTDKFRGIKLQNKLSVSPTPPDSIEFDGNIMKVSNWIKQSNGEFGSLVGINNKDLSVITTFVNADGLGLWNPSNPLPFNVTNNTIRFVDDKIFVLALNGSLINSVMLFSYVKGFIDLRKFDWYQVSDVTRCYESMKSILSFSNIKDIISDENVNYTSEIGKIKFIKPSSNNKYNDGYIISNKNLSLINGDTVYDNWYTHYKTWDEEDKTWDTVNILTKLSLVLNKNININ